MSGRPEPTGCGRKKRTKKYIYQGALVFFIFSSSSSAKLFFLLFGYTFRLINVLTDIRQLQKQGGKNWGAGSGREEKQLRLRIDQKGIGLGPKILLLLIGEKRRVRCQEIHPWETQQPIRGNQKETFKYQNKILSNHSTWIYVRPHKNFSFPSTMIHRFFVDSAMRGRRTTFNYQNLKKIFR